MIDFDKLSDHDKILAKELDRCRDFSECHDISEQAEDEVLKMMALQKSIRLWHRDEYKAGMI